MIQNEAFIEICSHYELADFISARPVYHTPWNRSYVLTATKGTFFIKAYARHLVGKVESTITTELFFTEGGFPVARRLLGRSSKYYFEWGNWIFSAFEYYEVPIIREWNVDKFLQLGIFLGRMHAYSLSKTVKPARKWYDPHFMV